MHNPQSILDNEILDSPNLSVRAVNVISEHLPHASQMSPREFQAGFLLQCDGHVGFERRTGSNLFASEEYGKLPFLPVYLAESKGED